MKGIWKILTLCMAVALVAISIQLATLKQSSGGESTNLDVADVVYNTIMTRSSVRSYTRQPIEDEKIEKMLRAGMAAPSGGNKQPWEFLVINDREILDQFPDLVGSMQMASQAPLAIAVLGSPSKAFLPGYWVQDCCAATENILITAHAMGLGAVWCGVYPENGTGRFKKINDLLNLPSNLYTLNVIFIGYPDSEPQIKDKWSPEKVRYNRY